MRCKPDENPWDVILLNGHGPEDVASVDGCVHAYEGVRKTSDFPCVLEEVILEVTNQRNFHPKALVCDNAGEFISDLAKAMYSAYHLHLDSIAPKSPQAGGLWEKCVGDVKRRSTTSTLQAPWMPASARLLSDQYAVEVQMYYSEYPSANPNFESLSSFRIQHLNPPP